MAERRSLVQIGGEIRELPTGDTLAGTGGGAGADSASIVTSENLVGGDLVNLYDLTGVPTARKADASLGRPAHGFVLAATTSPAVAVVYFEGSNTQMSGLVGGERFLSITEPGKTQTNAPTASGHIIQIVGFSTSVTAMNFQSRDPIVLA